MNCTKEIASLLQKADIKIGKVLISDCPDIEDDTIELNDVLHVQVGEGYINLVEMVADTFMFTEINSVMELILAIQEKNKRRLPCLKKSEKTLMN